MKTILLDMALFAWGVAASSGSVFAVTSAAPFPCVPAHSYPDGVSCVLLHGTFTLMGPSATTTDGKKTRVSATTTLDPPPAYSTDPTVSAPPIGYTLTPIGPESTSTTTLSCDTLHAHLNGTACVPITSRSSTTTTLTSRNHPFSPTSISTSTSTVIVTSGPVTASTTVPCDPSHPHKSCVLTFHSAITVVPVTSNSPSSAAATSAVSVSPVGNDATELTVSGVATLAIFVAILLL